MRVHYLQHVYFEGPAGIAEWVHKKGHSLTGTHLYNREAVPQLDQFDFLVIMGGPMNIYEEESYPWLGYEKKFIREAIDGGKTVLGICLGAQLIADVLGGRVTKNPEREIGWLPVEFRTEALQSVFFKGFPQVATVFQWHGDTFSTLAEGIRCIAESEACTHQAFMYGDRVFGFQFHLESSESAVDALMHHCAEDMASGRYVQTEEQIRSGKSFLKAANHLMYEFLEQLEADYLKRRC